MDVRSNARQNRTDAILVDTMPYVELPKRVEHSRDLGLEGTICRFGEGVEKSWRPNKSNYESEINRLADQVWRTYAIPWGPEIINNTCEFSD